MLRVKKICKERGIRLSDLADEMGITRQSLHAAITGNPTLSTLYEIADKLKVPIIELFPEFEQRPE